MLRRDPNDPRITIHDSSSSEPEIVRTDRIQTREWRNAAEQVPLTAALYKRGDGSVYGVIQPFAYFRWTVAIEREPEAMLGYLGRLYESDGLAAVERELVALGLLSQTPAGVAGSVKPEPWTNFIFPVGLALAGAWLVSR